MNEPGMVAVVFAKHMAWHAGAAVILSSVVYATLRSWKLAALCFVACFYTDLDHMFEYSMIHGLKIDLHSVMSGEYFTVVDRRFLWLHSYETLLIVWLWAWAKKKYQAATAFSAGLVSHLVIDQLSYPLKPLSYFLIYRWAHGFSAQAFGL